MDGDEWNAVYTLEDLAERDWEGVPLAVLGSPIKHSISPVLHNAALARMARVDARFGSWRYWKFDVAPERLPEALELFHRKRFRGLNLTIPHKTQAVELAAEGDPASRRMGAFNTLERLDSGWRGWNTDGFGLSKAVEIALGRRFEGADVVLLGAGGASRAAAAQALLENCRSLWIGNRSAERLEALLETVRCFPGGGEKARGFSLADSPKELPAGGLLVNATSLGLRPGDPAPIDLSRFGESLAVFDMIYNPPETALLAQARKLGMRSANGLSMLVWQAARALEIWSGADVPADAMTEAGLDALK